MNGKFCGMNIFQPGEGRSSIIGRIKGTVKKDFQAGMIWKTGQKKNQQAVLNKMGNGPCDKTIPLENINTKKKFTFILLLQYLNDLEQLL
jgi:hypothetical protein